MPRPLSLFLGVALACACETGCLLGTEDGCDDFSDIATCRELESIALLLPGAYCNCSACKCTNTAVVERMTDCPTSKVIIKADFSHNGSSHLACVEINLEPGRVERLDKEVIVSRAVVRGKAVVEAAPKHRVASVASGGYLIIEAVEFRNGFDGRIGGGCVLVNRNATLRATDVVFTNCTTVGFGGAILAWTQSTITLTGKTVISLSSASFGGALYAHSSSAVNADADVSIISCFAAQIGGGVALSMGGHFDLRGTIATCHAGIFGGAVIAISRDSHVSSIRFGPGARIAHCSAGLYGGCMGGEQVHLIIDGATITDCVAAYGGAALFGAVNMLVTGATQIGWCLASYGGGALFIGVGALAFIEQTVIHNCSTLYSHNTDAHGGAFYIWSAATVTLGEDAEVRDCAATQGGGIFMQVRSTLHMARGATIRNCYAASSGGGIHALVQASIKIEDAATGIQQCAAEVNGGGILSEAEVDIQLIASHITGNIAIAGNGGGLDLSRNSRLHASSGACIDKNMAAEGGGLHSQGLVMLNGHVDVAQNLALRNGGGALMVGENALLALAAAGYGLVEVRIDASEGINGAYLVIYEAHHTNGVRPYDASGASTEMHFELGTANKKILGLRRGATYEVRLVSATSVGWFESRASYALISEVGVPSTEGLFVEPGRHSASSYFKFPESRDRDRGPAFVNNRAVASGGGIALTDRASAYAQFTAMIENAANQHGGGVYVATLCHLDAVGLKFANNSASYGGGLYNSILSSVYLNDTVAVGNRAAREGGFSFFDTAKFAFVKNLSAVENSAGGSGGAISNYRTQSSTLSHCIFIGNQAVENGAAISARDNEITIIACEFYKQSADGDGTVALADTTVIFQRESCIHVDVVLDMTRTNVACQVISYTEDELTCDFFPQGCAYFKSEFEDEFSCDGCGCHSRGERYAAIFGTDAKEVARMFLFADAVRTVSVCLAPASTFHLQGFDIFGESWWGGTVQAFIGGNAVTPLLFVDKFHSDQAFFATPETMRTATGNNRVVGAGGFVFWTTSEPVYLFNNVFLKHDSVAGYGSFVATPPVSMRLARSNNTYTLGSGDTVQPIVVELIDSYGTVVTSAGGYTAIIRLTETHGFVINNLAEFNPRAVFTRTAIFDKPGAVVSAVVMSEVLSVSTQTVAITFVLRSCTKNEYESLVNSSGYSICTVCAEGEYLDTVSSACVRCSKGMSCQKPGNELTTLLTKDGWYRMTKTSKQLYACPRKKACPEGIAVGRATCAEGHIGLLCAACGAGWYQKINHKCLKCKSNDRRLALSVYCALLATLLFTTYWLICTSAASKFLDRVSEARAHTQSNHNVSPRYRVPQKSDDKQQLASKRKIGDTDYENASDSRADLLSMVVIKLKVILTFAQIVAALPSISLFRLRNSRFYWLAAIGSFVYASMHDLLPGQCVDSANAKTHYVRGLVFTTTFPVALAILLIAGYNVRKLLMTSNDTRSFHIRTRRVCTECILLMIHFMLPAASTATFLSLVCLDYDFGHERNPKSYMRVAPAISCSSNTFANFIVPWSLTCIFIYPVGVPASYMILLLRYRTILNPTRTSGNDECKKQSNSASLRNVLALCTGAQHQLEQLRVVHIAEMDAYSFVRAYQFLWIDYRPELYYFEVVEILRRLILTACLAIIAPGRPLQLLVGYIMSSIFTLITERARPFAQPDDNMVSIITQLCTTGSLFVFFLLRISILGPIISRSLIIVLALTPLVFVMYALRWFFPGCVWRPKSQVIDAVDKNSMVSPVQPMDTHEGAHDSGDCPDSASDDGCVSPKSDECLIVKNAEEDDGHSTERNQPVLNASS